ncbi:unnamed protein product [Meganyctiphanes norvegica]|uniref:Caspase family p20 domain-containing protein n=1 Tax=Meganyctiphanes norvegica TaxID=48144 RepID=A0AAV2R2U0_MEGNR
MSSIRNVNPQSETTNFIHKNEDHPEAKPMDYDIPNGRRGVVHIFNNYLFQNKFENLKSGPDDGEKILETFQKLNYKIRRWENLSKKQTDEAFESIVQTKGLCDENVIIFFILSHGSNEFMFLSSDNKEINLWEKMAMFQKDECTAMAYKPKLFFSDFCQGTKLQRGVGYGELLLPKAGPAKHSSYGTEEVLTETLHIMAANEDMASIARSNKDGSVFSRQVCRMLNRAIHQTQILDNMWFQELNLRLRRKESPNTVRTFYDPFPGQLFYPEGFSFGYDIDHINGKKE